MAASGAKVMMAAVDRDRPQLRCQAPRPLDVRGRAKEPGSARRTSVVLEKAIISGVTHDTSEAKVSIIGVPDQPGVAARVFRALAQAPASTST